MLGVGAVGRVTLIPSQVLCRYGLSTSYASKLVVLKVWSLGQQRQRNIGTC